MIERIHEVIADLNADDWKKRDRAQGDAGAHGPGGDRRRSSSSRESQPPEAQQRIDSILKELEKAKSGRQTAGATTVPGPGTAWTGM